PQRSSTAPVSGSMRATTASATGVVLVMRLRRSKVEASQRPEALDGMPTNGKYVRLLGDMFGNLPVACALYAGLKTLGSDIKDGMKDGLEVHGAALQKGLASHMTANGAGPAAP
ncbi:hypothetical protein TSOC_002653, partial [Tetrabaena socialis]